MDSVPNALVVREGFQPDETDGPRKQQPKNIFIGCADGNVYQYLVTSLGADEDFCILLDGERTRSFGELCQQQVVQKHAEGEEALRLRKLKKEEADARRRTMLEKKKNADQKEARAAELEKAKEGGHFGDLYGLMKDENPEEAARMKAQEDAARKKEMEAMKLRLRQEQSMVDKFQEEREAALAAAKKKEDRSKLKAHHPHMNSKPNTTPVFNLFLLPTPRFRKRGVFDKKR